MTRHPLFPAIAALWFGALFGLGSLAIRPGLIEGLVLKIGLDTVVPVAAPPLGVTARILIALALAAAGGALGAWIARKLAQPKVADYQRKRGAAPAAETSQRSRDAHPDAPARRPVSVNEEIGAGLGDSGSAKAPGRRSALVLDEVVTEFHVPDTAPLPGGAPQMLDLQTLATESEPVPPALPAQLPIAEDLPTLDLQEFSQNEPAPLELVAEMPVAAPCEPTQRQVFGQAPVQEPGQEQAAPPLDFAIPQAAPIDFSRPTEVARESLSAVIAEEAVPQSVFDTVPPAATVKTAAEPVSNPATSSEDLDQLDLVGLTRRFADSLKRRRELAVTGSASVADSAEAPLTLPSFTAPAAFSAEPASPVAPPLALPDLAAEATLAEAVDLPKLAIPAALRPLDLGHHEDDEEDYSSLLPLRRIAMPDMRPAASAPAVETAQSADGLPQFAAPTASEFVAAPAPELREPAQSTAFESVGPEEAEVDETESGYSSLLDLNRDPAPRQPFVRIEEPAPTASAIEPVVIFPGQAMGQAPTPIGAPFAAPTAAAEDTLRQFDAPGSAVTGQAVIGQTPVTVQDPEETERALRAALASLQRMSGAA